jgi:glutamyl-tRNA synthetase
MYENINDEIRKAAILNAVRHEGKANLKAVLGTLLGEHQELRAQANDLIPMVQAIVQEVNSASFQTLRELVNQKWPDQLSKQRQDKGRTLPPLTNADKYKKIVTRVAPNPDFVLHLGNARAAILSHDYARMYDGKFIVRFEDTDPRLKKAQLEYYEKIRQDLIWLSCKWDEEYIQSDRLPIYYEIGTTLIRKAAAYVCQCKPDQFRDKVNASLPCPDRSLSVETNEQRWSKMLEHEYKEGEAVVRVRTDLRNPNPAVRDWPAFRIIDTTKTPHPRIGSKFDVWPLYNLASGVDDHFLGITHIIRGKEHLTNMDRQLFMYNHLGWEYPEAIHYGRLKIQGMDLSKSKMMKAVEQGEISRVDDPRLGTLAALRRRGYSPKTIRDLIWDIGPKPVDVTISWDNLNSMNRKIIDPIAHRYYFVADPIEVIITGLNASLEVHPPLHPEQPDLGNRTIHIEAKDGKATLLVSGNDFNLLKSHPEVRFMNLFNFKPVVTSNAKSFAGEITKDTEHDSGAPILQWVPSTSNDNVAVQVLMPDGTQVNGFAEADLRKEAADSIIQFVRFGFCRVDSNSSKLAIACFAHQ